MKSKKLVYEESINEIDSFEAYYKNVLFRNNNLVVPYINLGFSDHELNPENANLLYLNVGYVAFLDVSYLKVFLNNAYIIIDINKSGNHFSFGGNYLDVNTKVFNDMEIGCKKALLHILDFSEISERRWIPVDTPKSSRNMDKTLVENFFSHKYIPNDLKTLIE